MRIRRQWRERVTKGVKGTRAYCEEILLHTVYRGLIRFEPTLRAKLICIGTKDGSVSVRSPGVYSYDRLQNHQPSALSFPLDLFRNLSRAANKRNLYLLTPSGNQLPINTNPPFGTTLGRFNPAGGNSLNTSLITAFKYPQFCASITPTLPFSPLFIPSNSPLNFSRTRGDLTSKYIAAVSAIPVVSPPATTLEMIW